MNINSADTVEILTLAEEIRGQIALKLTLFFADRHVADAEHTHADRL